MYESPVNLINMYVMYPGVVLEPAETVEALQ